MKRAIERDVANDASTSNARRFNGPEAGARASREDARASKGKESDERRAGKKRRSGRHALSIDRFVNARRSTYDKRERIKSDKAEAAAKRAKYERLQKKLTGTYERREEFDPEMYERRLAMIDDPDLAREDMKRRREEEESLQREATAKACATGEEADGAGKDTQDDAPEERRSSKGKKKKFDYLAAAWEKGQTERDEREAQRKEFLEKRAAREAERREQVAKRSTQKQLMRKKTSRGQPVMKHRVQSILDKLQAELAGKSA